MKYVVVESNSRPSRTVLLSSNAHLVEEPASQWILQDSSPSEKSWAMGHAGMQCIRICFVLLNILVTLGSCGALGLGIWLHVHTGGYARVVYQYAFFSAAIFLISMGCIGIFVCIMGCCGAWLINRCLLLTYFILVLVLFLVEVGAGIYLLIFRDTLTDNVRYELRLSLRTNYLPHSSLSTAWDTIQRTFGCCGVDNQADWHFIAAWPELAIAPDSCCIPEARNLPNCGKSLNYNLIYPRGCFEVIRDYATRNMYIFAIAAVCLAFVQLFGLVSAMVLFCGGHLAEHRKLIVRTEEPEVVEVVQTEPKPKYVETNL
ncbi:tetraspanin-9-like [Paramacrobiotus metropolitanus]|uniref:tetraspanin-9-like n=1 Tax=Paramacrobiotus metropolitanus TaxID=2943436 RepID=UPI0024458ECF|nr:tetraspanin-9-like [Paramacrobiotus metropolitanus]